MLRIFGLRLPCTIAFKSESGEEETLEPDNSSENRGTMLYSLVITAVVFEIRPPEARSALQADEELKISREVTLETNETVQSRCVKGRSVLSTVTKLFSATLELKTL